MKKDEIRWVLERIEVVRDWFDDKECSITNKKAQDLIEKLDMIIYKETE